MDDYESGYEFDEGSDLDNWEEEQVFQDGVLDRAADDEAAAADVARLEAEEIDLEDLEAAADFFDNLMGSETEGSE